MTMKILFIFFSSLAWMAPQLGLAESSYSKSFKTKLGPGSSASLEIKNRTAFIQNHLENVKAKEKSTPLSWPAFPRIWMERTSSDTKTSSTSIGLTVNVGPTPSAGAFKAPGLSINTKKSVEFKYTVTTSVIFIASTGETSDTQTIAPNENEDVFLTANPATGLVYPKVTKERSMVGLCYFEMSLNEDALKAYGIDFLGSSYARQTGLHEMAKLSRFSAFFQIEPNVAIESYHFEECANRFRREVEKSVNRNFSLLIQQMQNNTCAPALKNNPNPDGERSCAIWMDQFPDHFKKRFLPRCEQNPESGGYQCVLKSRKGMSCPLYADRKTLKYSEKFDFKTFNMKIAGGDTAAFPCDHAMKQRCELQSQPRLVFGVPWKYGKAVCK